LRGYNTSCVVRSKVCQEYKGLNKIPKREHEKVEILNAKTKEPFPYERKRSKQKVAKEDSLCSKKKSSI